MEPLDIVQYGKKRSEEETRDYCDIEETFRKIPFKRPLTHLDFKVLSSSCWSFANFCLRWNFL
jgi:hypothetical protein